MSKEWKTSGTHYNLDRTDHSGEVAGREQVFSVEGEEDDGHAGEDEVVEGDVHSCLPAPVG